MRDLDKCRVHGRFLSQLRNSTLQNSHLRKGAASKPTQTLPQKATPSLWSSSGNESASSLGETPPPCYSGRPCNSIAKSPERIAWKESATRCVETVANHHTTTEASLTHTVWFHLYEGMSRSLWKAKLKDKLILTHTKQWIPCKVVLFSRVHFSLIFVWWDGTIVWPGFSVGYIHLYSLHVLKLGSRHQNWAHLTV